jgi:hypothetical protein
MANFVKLNKNNVVEQLVMVHNNELLDENGQESEAKGIEFLHKLYKDNTANWKKTSYNTRLGKYFVVNENNEYVLGPDQSKAFRKMFAQEGDVYDPVNDWFLPPQPFPSWTFDQEKWRWFSPQGLPKEDLLPNEHASWNEELQQWEYYFI